MFEKRDFKNAILVLLLVLINVVGLFGQNKTGINYSFELKDGYEFNTAGKVLQVCTDAINDTNCFYVLNDYKNDLVPYKKQKRNYYWIIPIFQGENTLTIVLQDKEGHKYIPYSPDTTFFHQDFGYWILSVGTGNCPKDTNRLECSTSDAEWFVEIVKKSVGGLPMIEPLCLNNSHATKDSIKNAAYNIIESIDNNKDMIDSGAVFIYFSGHGKNENGFSFQVKDTLGYDSDYLTQEEITEIIQGMLGKIDNMDIWLFFDTCHSSSINIDLGTPGNTNNGSLIINSAVITDGKRFKSKISNNGDYCEEIKKCNSLDSIVIDLGKNGHGEYADKAIDGLYMNFFNRSLEGQNLPVKYDALHGIINKYYNGNLVNPDLKGYAKESASKPSFPIGVFTPTNTQESLPKTIPSGFIDISIGWNISNQWNPQIGATWKNWSLFLEYSGNSRWSTDITHTLQVNETEQIHDTLTSKYIKGLGAGLRWYPFNNKLSWYPLKSIETGFSCSAQTGIIYGEKVISEKEIIKHSQSFTCITPALSLRFFISRNKCLMCFVNVGYAFYYPHNINVEMKPKSFVTNVGISIPVYYPKKITSSTEL